MTNYVSEMFRVCVSMSTQRPDVYKSHFPRPEVPFKRSSRVTRETKSLKFVEHRLHRGGENANAGGNFRNRGGVQGKE